MKNNPFTSSIYQTIWVKHFAANKEIKQFNFIKGVQFLKFKFLPLFINLGKNNTNAINYKTDVSAIDYKGKVFLIYDVPNYLEIENETGFTTIKVKRIRQYRGYLLNLEPYADFDEYFKNRFSKNRRRKHRGYLNKLNKTFDVDFKIYAGSIEENEYLSVMMQFKELLTKRFNKLGLDNDILNKWNFYEDLVYPMIQEKKALLNVIYLNKKVVAASLVFLSENSAIGAIKTFDINYKNYNLGNIEMMKAIEFCIDTKIPVFDFSKGDQDYKTRYISDYYHFDCHVLYDSKSLKATIIAQIITRYFSFKQYLRDKNFNLLFIKIKYQLKRKFKKGNTLK